MKMAAVQSSVSYCVKEKKECTVWVKRYFKDCLCNFRDDLSFGFGILSFTLWGIAEIPQIMTNFKTKSGHGISIAFLLICITGDIFNLVGCILEPATLPTQFYTALLYTSAKVVLVLQSLYYDYYPKFRHGQQKDSTQEVKEMKKPLITDNTDQSKPCYFMSEGSLEPPTGSNLWPIKSGPSTVGIENDPSSDDGPDSNIPSSSKPSSKPKPITSSAGSATFLATLLSMPRDSNALVQVRKLLQEGGSESLYGQLLGWLMAAIYMGARLPQICLNIKRGSIEGLNPFMFVFILFANGTYVASILVRSIAWDKIKANLPWLTEAVSCVVLDFFIILQYVYYRFLRKVNNNNDDKEGYVDGNQ